MTAGPVAVERVWGTNSIISSGLAGGETVVVNGQLLLSNGTKVDAREAKAGQAARYAK